VRVRFLVECILGTSAAIILSVLAQVVLTTLWPKVTAFSFGGISADSYLTVVAVGSLSAFVGFSLRARGRHRYALLLAVAVPTLWLGAMLYVILPTNSPIALNAVTVFTMIAAIAPLVGVAAGWFTAASRELPSNKAWSGP